jgi:hypothetical protein
MRDRAFERRLKETAEGVVVALFNVGRASASGGDEGREGVSHAA